MRALCVLTSGKPRNSEGVIYRWEAITCVFKTLVGESGCRASSSACPAFCLPHGGEFISYLNPTLDKGANQTIERAAFFTTHGLIQDGGHYAVRVSFGEGTGGGVVAEPQSFYFVCRTVARKLRRTL